jgi:hypothetical protein
MYKTQRPEYLPTDLHSPPTVVTHSAAMSAGTMDLLNAQNAVRDRHHAGPLIWDDTLAQTARQAGSACNYAMVYDWASTPGRLQWQTGGDTEQVSSP